VEDTWPNKNQDGNWRIRTNEEIDLLITLANIVKYVKAQRIRWVGHIVGLDKERMVKRITEWRPPVVRRIDRSRLRREDDVKVDLGKMMIQN